MDIESTPGLSVEIVKITRLPDERIPPTHQCGFAYTIKINNDSIRPATVLGRKWMIKQADGELETVEGEGVVGEQPVIEPGKHFTYTSFCLLYGDHGSMWGYYFGTDDEETPIMWRIPRFDMSMKSRPDSV